MVGPIVDDLGDGVGDISLSDAARNWGEGVAASEAGSRVSVRSEVRREQARREYEQERERRRAAYERMEREYELKMEEEMDAEDLKSERAERAAEGGSAPVFLPVKEEVKEEFMDQWRRTAAQEVPRFGEFGSPGAGTGTWATVFSRVKAKEPKAWTGEFDYVKREIWLRSAALYLASIGLDLQARIDELRTPLAFGLIRALFSDTAANGRLSPQAWFDARNRRTPFKTTNEVFDAVRSHWADSNAAETAFRKYRTARQGTMKAREFGTELDGLADACFDRSISDLDRRSTFLAGLNANVSDFVRTQIAAIRILGKEGELDFDKVVEIASATDDLSAFSKKSSVSSSLTGGQSSRADNALTPRQDENKPAFSSWSDRARKWQQENPWGSKASWFVASGPKSNKPVRCYNCGEMTTHFSYSCPNPRRSPAQVVVAALATKAASHSSSSSSATPASEASGSMTIASASITDLGEEEKA